MGWLDEVTTRVFWSAMLMRKWTKKATSWRGLYATNEEEDGRAARDEPNEAGVDKGMR